MDRPSAWRVGRTRARPADRNRRHPDAARQFPAADDGDRLKQSGTAIWSAIALDEPQMRRIDALGSPGFLIVPNAQHRLDAKIWKARYPAIKVLAPPSAKEAV